MTCSCIQVLSNLMFGIAAMCLRLHDTKSRYSAIPQACMADVPCVKMQQALSRRWKVSASPLTCGLTDSAHDCSLSFPLDRQGCVACHEEVAAWGGNQGRYQPNQIVVHVPCSSSANGCDCCECHRRLATACQPVWMTCMTSSSSMRSNGVAGKHWP